MFCAECGKQISDEAKFCDYCGASTNSQQPNTEASSSSTQATKAPVSSKENEEKSESNNYGLKTILFLAGFFFIAILLSNYKFNSPQLTEIAQTDTTQLEQGSNDTKVSAEEKAKLAAEAESMRAASVERERTVGKMEQEQLRRDADAGNNSFNGNISQIASQIGAERIVECMFEAMALYAFIPGSTEDTRKLSLVANATFRAYVLISKAYQPSAALTAYADTYTTAHGQRSVDEKLQILVECGSDPLANPLVKQQLKTN